MDHSETAAAAQAAQATAGPAAQTPIGSASLPELQTGPGPPAVGFCGSAGVPQSSWDPL